MYSTYYFPHDLQELASLFQQWTHERQGEVKTQDGSRTPSKHQGLHLMPSLPSHSSTPEAGSHYVSLKHEALIS